MSDLADWWDEKEREAESYLHDFVAETGSWWRVAIAGSVTTAMRLGSGFVDTLRLGDGVSEGGWRGFTKDGLRLLSLAGPVSKAGRGLTRFVTPNPGGGICAWVSASQALRQTGVRHFATIEDLAEATGYRLIPGAVAPHQFPQILRYAGADVRPAVRVAHLEEVTALASSHPNGVVIFGVSWDINQGGKIIQVGHALYAYRRTFGGVRIVDRSGAVVRSLTELKAKYPGIENAVTSTASVVENATVVRTLSNISTIAVETRAALAATRGQADAKLKELKRRRNGPSVGKALTRKPGGKRRTHLVKLGETWHSIASLYTSADKAGMLSGGLQALSYSEGYTEWMAPFPKPGTVLEVLD